MLHSFLVPRTIIQCLQTTEISPKYPQTLQQCVMTGTHTQTHTQISARLLIFLRFKIQESGQFDKAYAIFTKALILFLSQIGEVTIGSVAVRKKLLLEQPLPPSCSCDLGSQQIKLPAAVNFASIIIIITIFNSNFGFTFFHLYLQESKSDPETSLEATNIQLLCSRTPVSFLKEHDMFNVVGFSAPGPRPWNIWTNRSPRNLVNFGNGHFLKGQSI